LRNRGRRGKHDFRPAGARRRRGRGAGACSDLCAPAGGHGLPCDGPRRRGHAGSSTGGSGFCGEIATARETPGEGAGEERREVGKMEPAPVRVEAA
jgi:hypothetical protein